MNKKTALPKQLTTITPLSKALAMLLFTALPFIGFMLGKEYGRYLSTESTINTTVEKQNKYKNEVTKEIKDDYEVVKLKVYGRIVPLNITDIEVGYRYKIVLIEPVTDKDAISDASGLNRPKIEYIIVSTNPKITALFSSLEYKLVEIQGELAYGLAETRHLSVDFLKML